MIAGTSNLYYNGNDREIKRKRGCGVKFANTKSVKFKIVLYTTVCLLAVGVLSNLYLFTSMNRVISQKVEDIDALYLDTIQAQLDKRLSEMMQLGVLCSSNYEVARAMRNPSMTTVIAKREMLTAQTVLNDYLRYVNLYSNHVNKMLAFNKDGMVTQATAMLDGNPLDVPNLMASPLYTNRFEHAADPYFWAITPSITPFKPRCLAALFPVFSPLSPTRESYIYIELDLSVVTDLLDPYTKLNPIFVVTDAGEKVVSKEWVGHALYTADLSEVQSGDVFTAADGAHYRIDIRPLNTAGLSVYSCIDLSMVSVDNRRMIYTLIVVILSVLLVSICVLSIISNYITRPIQKLITRIKKISANDFSYDPEIEKSGDEIGEIGKVVNEMNLSIVNLLRESEEQSEQKKNIEINLLQSQVNPHFLYNTLDSIHWMAVIQKNPGICNITRALSNLLKNMAKGFSQKISLEEELGLLNDYVTIQSIRYMETFELVNHISKALYRYPIVKLTLQPLVENAIFHGIEPSGVYGTITLDAHEDGDFLIITVEDSGVGMTAEALVSFKHTSHAGARNSMNGIGMANVDKRLRLVYGAGCGLSVESEAGEFTRVSVRIRKEEVV